MGQRSTPPRSVVQTVTAAGLRVLRSVNLIADAKPAGVPWICKDPRKEYKFGSELGHGNYGVVHLVTHARSGRIYACKILRNHSSKVQQQHLMAEVNALHLVDSHQNIATLHEVWEYSGYLYLIMEACLGGELFDVIMHRGHFSEKDAAVVFRVILDVVQHCHKHGVAHRDLKPENFLLKRKALNADQPLRAEDLRLVDFGLAITLAQGDNCTELLGSPFYIAPEILKGSYGFEADVWSTGVILYILLSGLPPFPGNNEKQIFQRILRLPLDLDSDAWRSISDEAKNLLSMLLQRDPKKRVTPAEGLKHTWLLSAANEVSAQSDMLIQRLRAFTEMSKLQGLLMNVIAKNMSTEGIDALRDVFDELDTNRDGYLSFEELRQGMENASGESEAGNRAAQAVMAALDVSGDGYIEYHEFLAAVLDRQRTLTDQTIAEMFALLDKNQDGKLTAAELRSALAESGIDISENALSELMQDMPGAIAGQEAHEAELTRESFAYLLRGSLQNEEVMLSQLEGALSDLQKSFSMRNRFKQLAMLVIARTTPVSELHGLQELFQQLDVDNSGLLSLDELRRGLKHMDSELGDEEIEELLEFMDVDGNHMVDYHEFVMGTLEDKQLLTEAKLRAAFDFFDKDRNGYIDIGEVGKAIKDLGIRMKQSPRDLLLGADSNEDEVVDFGEFRDMMLSADPAGLVDHRHPKAAEKARANGHHSSRSQMSFSETALQARQAAVPQHIICSTIHEDLLGGQSAMEVIKKEFAAGNPARQKADNAPAVSMSVNLPFETDTVQPGLGKDGTKLGRRSASAVAHEGEIDRLAAVRSPLWSHGRAGSDSQIFQPRRRRHLVFINAQGLPQENQAPIESSSSSADSIGSSSKDLMVDARPQSRPKVDSRMPKSPFLSDSASSCPLGAVHANKVIGTQQTNLVAASQQGGGPRGHGEPNPPGLAAMLSFMDDHWSRNSILSLQSGRA